MVTWPIMISQAVKHHGVGEIRDCLICNVRKYNAVLVARLRSHMWLTLVNRDDSGADARP